MLGSLEFEPMRERPLASRGGTTRSRPKEEKPAAMVWLARGRIPDLELGSMRNPRREPVLVATLSALALALRLYRLDWGLPGVFEEAVPFWRAWGIWGWGPGRHFDLNP